MLTAQPQFLNRFIANYSSTIIDTINNFTVPDIPAIEEKVEGVKVSIALSKIKQKVAIHWATNIVSVQDRHSFKINSKNINITLDAHIEAKVGLFRKQKGQLVVTVSQLEADTVIMFDNPKCPKSFGFDIQIKDVYLNTKNFDVKI